MYLLFHGIKNRNLKPDCGFDVPRTGVEPALLSKYAPETYASTNSAIGAKESVGFSMVPRTRVELACRNRHYPLKVACLPISPPGLEFGGKDTTIFETSKCFFNFFQIKKRGPKTAFPMVNKSSLLHFLDDGLESFRIVQSEVGQHFTVDLDTGFVQLVHEHAVRHVILADGCIDTDDPQGSEVTLLVPSVAVSVGLSFFVGVFRHSPDILSGSELTFGLLEDFLAPGS